jgi:hypothetical protein
MRLSPPDALFCTFLSSFAQSARHDDGDNGDNDDTRKNKSHDFICWGM